LSSSAGPDEVVSHDSENLILVDSQDQVRGSLDKAACHDGQGVLHRAFSLFIFNSAGELLLQQRSSQKRLWPGYWSNSCCSHPRHGEEMTEAVQRRLEQELGIRCPLHMLYKFQYQASFKDLGSEHELCWVYLGRCDDPIRANRNEIDDWRFVAAAELDREMRDRAGDFTPWFRMEWEQVKGSYQQVLGLG
jgi:isopentenyl-diphosphate delta-isomerase